MTSTVKDLSELPVSLKVEDLGRILGISRASAYSLARSKGFPAVRIGEKRVVIPRDRFIAWFNSKADQPLD
jgi:predicted DNA-binding transcriptional regulator AlpA